MDEKLEQVVAQVRAGARYATLNESLVQHVAAQELAKGRSLKEAVKTTRSKLHQVAGAYQEQVIPYPRLQNELDNLSSNQLQDSALRDFCRQTMRFHTSTRERLPFVEDFYQQILTPLAPLRSVLDLACGLNPLALPWMPLDSKVEYHACDIYTDLADFLNHFFKQVGCNGQASVCDLTQDTPQREVQLVLLLKTIPCLEQLDKQIAIRLLTSLHAEHALVSFPAHSLGGRSKGMPQNYEAHFRQLVAGQNWHIQRFEFAAELAFLIRF